MSSFQGIIHILFINDAFLRKGSRKYAMKYYLFPIEKISEKVYHFR